MWINKFVYETMRVKSQADDILLANAREQNKVLQVSMDWLRVRVTQLERERAVMVEKFYGVTIAVPEIISAPDPFANHPGMSGFDFNDVGDEEAMRLGIGHNSEGAVVYSK